MRALHGCASFVEVDTGAGGTFRYSVIGILHCLQGIGTTCWRPLGMITLHARSVQSSHECNSTLNRSFAFCWICSGEFVWRSGWLSLTAFRQACFTSCSAFSAISGHNCDFDSGCTIARASLLADLETPSTLCGSMRHSNHDLYKMGAQ